MGDWVREWGVFVVSIGFYNGYLFILIVVFILGVLERGLNDVF